MEDKKYTLNSLAAEIHTINRDKGFWDNPRNFGEVLALVHSELSEALEEYRNENVMPPVYYVKKDNVDGGYTIWMHQEGYKPEGVAVELIDAIIRLLDMLEGFYPEVNIERTLKEKLAYNVSRPRLHGRRF
jgi:hypothetical protein